MTELAKIKTQAPVTGLTENQTTWMNSKWDQLKQSRKYATRTPVSTAHGHDFIERDPYWDLNFQDRQVQVFIEQASKPAKPEQIFYHVTELAKLKRIDGGGNRVSAIQSALMSDLQEVSEWAVIETCTYFRRKDCPFFPDVGEFYQYAKRLFDDIQSLKNGVDSPYKAKRQEKQQQDDQPDMTRKICQTYRAQFEQDFSVIGVMGKVQALVSKFGSDQVLSAIEQEKPQMRFDEWLDQKLSVTAKQ